MRKRTSKRSKVSFSDETSPVCRMCLSADGALQPITSDERGAYLLQKILAYTDVEMKILDKCPSYLCSACKSRLDSFDKFRCLCVLKNEKVERFREVVDTTHLTAAEHPDGIHQTDGVESVSVKTEVVAEDSEEDCQPNRVVSNSEQISSTYDYNHNDDLFEAEEESLEAVLKREPMDDEQQLQLSDADLKHELKTDPSNFNCKDEGEDSKAGKIITNPDDSVSISDPNNSCITHNAEAPTSSPMDPTAEEDSGYPCHPSVSKVDEQKLLPSNEHKSPQQDITAAEISDLPRHGSKIDVHRIKHKHQCPHCSATYPKASFLMIHLRTHTGEKPFQCDVCDKTFHAKHLLTKHTRIHNKDQQNQPGEGPFRCEDCGKAFHSKDTLTGHARIHNKDQHHQCPQCPKKFAMRRELKYHILKHTGEKPFQCEVCGNAFHAKAILHVHMDIHKKDQQHKCPQCPQKFARTRELEDHIRTHTGEKPFQCKVCDKAFHAKSILRIHSKIHQTDQHHQCPQCPQKFVRAYQLKIHIRKHTCGKPFQCKVGAKAFHAKHLLTKHTRIHNKDQQGQGAPTGTGPCAKAEGAGK